MLEELFDNGFTNTENVVLFVAGAALALFTAAIAGTIQVVIL